MRTSRDRAKADGSGSKGRVVLVAIIGQAALAVPILVFERRMRRTGGPGIIGFELAGTPQRASKIMGRWGGEGRKAARASLLVDFPYLLTYTVLQHAACQAAGRALGRGDQRPLAQLAGPIASAQLGAGAFDAVENAALLGVLAGKSKRLPLVARRCAQVKFALLTAGWIYGALGLISHAVRKRGSRSISLTAVAGL